MSGDKVSILLTAHQHTVGHLVPQKCCDVTEAEDKKLTVRNVYNEHWSRLYKCLPAMKAGGICYILVTATVQKDRFFHQFRHDTPC